MPRQYVGSDWTHLYYQTLFDVYTAPDYTSAPRGLPVREVLNATICYTAPADGGIIDFSRTGAPDRQAKYDEYRVREHEWYLSGSLKAEDIGAFWRSIADARGNVVSNYGYICLHDRKYLYNGKQLAGLDYVVARLKDDPDTRQAIIHYNEPKHHCDNTGNPKDHPCTMHDQFFLRDGVLHLTVCMRSNDMIKGISYDMPWACWLVNRAAEMLGVKSGSVTFCDGSLHVYKKDEELIRRILSTQHLPEVRG